MEGGADCGAMAEAGRAELFGEERCRVPTQYRRWCPSQHTDGIVPAERHARSACKWRHFVNRSTYSALIDWVSVVDKADVSVFP